MKGSRAFQASLQNPSKGVCSTYMKGSRASQASLQNPPKGVCSTYMKGSRAFQAFRNPQKEFVPPI